MPGSPVKSRLVEAISSSNYWKDSAIFVVEDDAQAGPDHVDSHRSVLLLASPFARRGAVDHTFYSTASVLRTIELILGTIEKCGCEVQKHRTELRISGRQLVHVSGPSQICIERFLRKRLR